MPYAPSLENLQNNARVCKHCGKSGYMSYQHWPGEGSSYHCNKCGCNQEV